MMSDYMVHNGDSLEILEKMPDECIHTAVTSPPYWGLRDYGVDGQLGLEETPDEYVNNLCNIFDELNRVLRDDGTFWLNIGDTYKDSDLTGIPWKVAFEMKSRGWILRQDVIWNKKSTMPESVTNRCVKSHEYIFLFSKNKSYHFDHEAIKEKGSGRASKNKEYKYEDKDGHETKAGFMDVTDKKWDKRNKRDVWSVNPASFSDSHFACVSDDTEILTKEGWKNYQDLRISEKVATYSIEEDKIELEQLRYVKDFDVDEPLFHIGNRDLDIMITQDHRNVVKNRDTYEVSIKRGYDLIGRDEIKVQANEVDWEENNGLGLELSELVGWIVAEGHYADCGIRLYQNNGADAERIQHLLNHLCIPHSHNKRRGNQNTWNLKKSKWTKFIKDFCPNKKLNQFLVSMPKRDLKALFDGIIGGDGYVRKDDGRISNTEKENEEQDWFQILALRLGYHSIIGQKDVHLTERESIGIRGTNGDGLNIEEVDYNGKVWCPNTPNGTWIARRNGRPFITGNTYPQELIKPCIKAGCPDDGIVLDPFFGAGTTGVVAKRLDRKFVGIELNEEYIDIAEERLDNYEWGEGFPKKRKVPDKAKFLTSVDGIGRKTALNIWDHFDHNVYDIVTSDLTEVSGIGEKTFKSFKEAIT